MKIVIQEINNSKVAEILADDVIIHNAQDAVDLMMNCAYQGADSLIILEHNLSPGFFDLKTGLAGDILQKFSTYQMRLVIIGNFDKFTSKSLRDFIYESNNTRRIAFVGSRQQALEVLSHN